MPISRINTNSIANNSINASDLLDASITAAKIISVANTQITGNIVSSQITSVGGSQITANTIANSAFQTGAVENYMNAAGLGFGMRNRIINGAMMIDQRNAGASVTPTSSGYTLDRWQAVVSQSSKYSVQQNAGAVTPPAGFTKYLGVTSLSAYSVAAGDFFALTHYIEGLNTADLGFGAAGASTVTMSFWVRSSLTGSFGGSLQNSAQNRCYPFTYTISAANTWEQKTVTIAGDTTGTWLTDSGRGIGVVFGLGVGSTYGSGTANAWVGSQIFVPTGSTSVVGTNGATFYITGVQLEKGSVATSFDYRPYGTELALCQRYYWQCVKVMGGCWLTDTCYNSVLQFPVTMRTTPTLASSSTFTARTGSNGTPAISTGVTGLSASPDAVWVYNSASNWTVSSGNQVTLNGGFSAEF